MEENGFSPQNYHLARAPHPVNCAHPETPHQVPLRTQRRQHLEFRLPTGSLPAPCPQGIILCWCLPLISSPSRKTRGNLTGWQPALILPPFPSPLAQPCHPARENNPLPATEGGSTPKPTPTPATDGPSGTGHIPSPPVQRLVGVCTHVDVPILLPSSPKGH